MSRTSAMLMIEMLELAFKHQPGRHDQQRHAGKRPDSYTVEIVDRSTTRNVTVYKLKPGDDISSSDLPDEGALLYNSRANTWHASGESGLMHEQMMDTAMEGRGVERYPGEYEFMVRGFYDEASGSINIFDFSGQFEDLPTRERRRIVRAHNKALDKAYERPFVIDGKVPEVRTAEPWWGKGTL